MLTTSRALIEVCVTDVRTGAQQRTKVPLAWARAALKAETCRAVQTMESTWGTGSGEDVVSEEAEAAQQRWDRLRVAHAAGQKLEADEVMEVMGWALTVEEQLQKQQADAEARAAAMRQGYQQELAALEAQHAGALAARLAEAEETQRTRYDSALQGHAQRIEELSQALAAQKAAHTAEMEAQKEQHDREAQEQSRRHAMELDALGAEGKQDAISRRIAEAVAGAASEAEAQHIADLKQFQAERERIAQEHQQALDALRAEHAAQLDTQKAHHAEARKEAVKLQKIQNTRKIVQAQMQAASEAKAAKRKLEAVRAQLEALQKDAPAVKMVDKACQHSAAPRKEGNWEQRGQLPSVGTTQGRHRRGKSERNGAR